MTPTEDLERLAASITPGPWTACAHLANDNENGCGCGYRGVVYGPEGGAICQPGHEIIEGEEGLEPPRYPRDQEVANARAIALLPELLAENIDLRKKVALLEKRLASGQRVKQLEWSESHMPFWNDDWHTVPKAYVVRCVDENGWRWAGLGAHGYATTPGSAKAAAQADYEARVLSALEPATSESADPVACALCEDNPKHPNIPCKVCGAHPQPLTVEAAAQLLLDKWMRGEFEDDADAIAQYQIDYGGDAADVIEAWLRALAAKGGQHE